MAAKKARSARDKGEGTIERRGPKEYVGYVRVRVDGVRRKLGTCFGSTEREVRMELNKWIAQGGIESALAPIVPVDAPIITGPFLQEWFDSKLPDWAETTRDTNKQNFAKHVKADTIFWNMPLTAVGYKAVIAFRDAIAGSANTKRNVMRLVRPAFDRAIKLGHISKNPFDLLDQNDKPKKSQSRIVAFKTEEMKKLLRYVERPGFDPLWRALVLFGFDMGAEPEEFLGIQVGDFNWDKGRVHLQRTCVEAGGGIVVKAEMKADKRNRNEPLAQRTLEAISALVGQVSPLSAHVFSPDGKPWKYDRFLKLWRKLLVEAGVEYLPPLSMRHTMASMMLAKGVPLPAVSKRLGHASIATTLNHYTHAMPDDTERLGHVSEAIFEALLRAA